MLKAVPGHTDSAKVTRLKIASAPAFWVENKYCISSLEEATLHVTFQVSLVPLWEHKNLCAFSRNSRTSQVCLALHMEVWGGIDSLTISTFLCKVFINPVKKGRCWSLSRDHTQHKPGRIARRKQWEQQLPLKKWRRCVTSSRTVPALWSSWVSRSQVRMRQKIRETEPPASCVSGGCCQLWGIRWDLMVTGIRLRIVTALSGPALAGQWAWLMTFFQPESTSCPKRVGFLCSTYLRVVRHDGEKKNGKYVCQGAGSRLVVNHYVEKKKGENCV